MSNFIDEIFERANIQQLGSFILTGSECVVDNRTYREQLEIDKSPIYMRLKKMYTNEDDFYKA